MKLITQSAILLLALPLTGCSIFHSSNTVTANNRSYLTAGSIPPLRTPPGVSSSAFHNEYPVSDRHYPESELKISTEPPGL